MLTKTGVLKKVWTDPKKDGAGFRYKAVLEDGSSYTTYWDEIGNVAKQLEGHPVEITINEKGFLQSIKLNAGSADPGSSEWATAEEAWKTLATGALDNTAQLSSVIPDPVWTWKRADRLEAINIAIEMTKGIADPVQRWSMVVKLVPAVEAYLQSA